MKNLIKNGGISLFYLNFNLKMKLTTFLLIVSILKIEASNYAQNTKITLDLNNVTIEKVLNEIEMKTEFRFLFNRKDIDVNKLVSVNVKREKVKNILNNMFLNMSVSYELLDKQIIIKNTPINKEENPVNLIFDQQIEIKGKVTDSNGTPLPGVSIIIVGTIKGTETDFDGNYSVKSDEGDVLEFSFIGMKTERIIVGTSTIINVQLKEDSASLDEVVVIGYGKMKRSDLTGSIASVSAKDFNKAPITSNEQLLQGKVAGLSVIQSSGDPTSAPTFRLRGGTSLSASNSPLIVVDGIAGVDFNSIQPSEIVSIDVLKDASASAIYGSRGANGVILVTTNSRRKGKNLYYNGYYTTGEVANNIDMLSANEWRKYVADNNPAGAVDFGGNTDWQKSIQRTSTINSHTLSFVNNGEDGGNRVSLNYLKNEGLILTSELEKIGVSLSGHQFALDKKLRVEAGIHSTFEESSNIDFAVFQRTFNLNPTIPIRDNNGEFSNVSGVFYENPVEILTDRTSDNKQQRIFSYAKAELEILKGLKGVVNVSYEYNSIENSLYIPTFAVLNGQTDNGRAVKSFSNFTNKQLESYLTYDLEFNDKHKLNFLAGYSYLDNTFEGFGAQRRGFDTDAFLFNNLGAGQDVRADDVNSNKRQAKLISFFGRANYSLLDKYLFTASIRRDGSSRFGANNKWGYFPSGSFGWKVSEESFMESTKGWLDNLKLRIGYGVTGNQDGIGVQKSLSLIGAGGNPYFDPSTGTWKQSFGIIQNENPNLKWESTAQFNVGVDFSIFKFLNGTFEFYDKQTSDLLFIYQVPQPPFLFGTILANVGDLSNQGVELTLNANLIKKTDLNWNATLTLSHNEQKIDKLSNDIFQTDEIFTGSLHGLPGLSGQFSQVIKEGFPTGTFWGPKSLGLDQNGEFIFANNGEAQNLGSAQPKYNIGFTMDLTYKKFDFQVATYGMFGQKVLNATDMIVSDPNRLPVNNTTDSSLESGVTSSSVFSSHFVEDASFLRLQNATIGYNVDTKKLGVEKLRIYLSGENLFVLTGYSGVDPEVNINGFDSPGIDVFNYYPKSRTFSLGVNLSF